MSVILYNVLLLAIEVIALAMAIRSRRGIFATAMAQPIFALVLSVLLGGGMFGVMGLLAYGLFIHTPLVFMTAGAALHLKSMKLSYFAFGLTAVNIAVGTDAFLIEPRALEVSKVNVTSTKVSKPLRIVVIADLQTDEVGEYEKSALKTALDQKPDLILFAGDYLQFRDSADFSRARKELTDYMASIGFSAPLGVYAVEGNVDPPNWSDIFMPIGATVFPATNSIERPDVTVTGLTLRDSFNPKLRISKRDRFHIVLGHGPDFALGDVDADLLVAGHTHGGQVVLPGIGPLMTLSAVPRKWASGRTELSGGRTLIVSRGVGMERGDAPRLRFLCRPEIVVVDVIPR